MAGGGQPGNKNGARGCAARDALRYELAALGRKIREKDGVEPNEDTGEPDTALMIGLRAVKRMEIRAAMSGNISAIKEISDRLDGKTRQAMELTGADGDPIDIAWKVEVISPSEDDGYEESAE